MSEKKLVIVAHMGHDAPWLQIKTAKEVRERRAYVRTQKPEHERALRLKLLKIVKEPLPPKLDKANASRVKANAVWYKARAAWDKAEAAVVKAEAALDKAYAAWDKVINSPAGVDFHKQVCGCAWTPEQPNILLQLEEQEDE